MIEFWIVAVVAILLLAPLAARQARAGGSMALVTALVFTAILFASAYLLAPA